MSLRTLVRPILASAVCAALAAPVQAGTVTVVTSFPKELTQAYKTAFEKAWKAIGDADARGRLKAAYDRKKAEIEPATPETPFDQQDAA